MKQMTARALPKSATAHRVVIAAIPAFDITHVMAKVARENPDWSQDRLGAAKNAYLVFMAHAKASPRTQHYVPSRDVDEVWHAHILHTRQYAADCSAYFGYFFHHTPFDGEQKMDSDLAMCDGNCGGNGGCDGWGG